MTTSSADAAARYAEGVDRLLAGVGGALAPLRAALAADDAFALAHMALAMALDEARDPTSAAQHRKLAQEHVNVNGASDRERSHVAILAALAAGPDPAGMEAARRHLAQWPRDGLLLDTYQRHLFFHGGAGRRQALVELFEALAPAWAGHSYAWYADAKLALHLEEIGQPGHLARAQGLAERSLAARRKNVSAVHALIHIAHAEGALAPRAHHAGAAQLEAWLQDIDAELGAAGALLTTHLWWHVALTALAAGNDATARSLWDERVRPARSSGSRQLALADAVGMLWSWRALRPSTCPPWDEAAALARQLAKSAAGRPFVDVHVATALLAVGDREGLRDLAGALESSTLPLARSVSLPLVNAIARILDEPGAALADFVRLLQTDAATLDAMGGSNVERALVVELAVHAAHEAHLELRAPLAAAAASSPHPLLAGASWR